MKNKRLNIVLIVVLLAVIVGAGVFAAIKLLDKPEEQPVVEVERKTVQLLSFESYEEMTGTQIRLGNSFGKMTINKDKAFITEGKGSIAVVPQGDYTRENWTPYMQMDCISESYRLSNFSELKSVSVDVYNDSEEERDIAIYFTIANFSENLMATPTVTFTLAPKAWTTCTYDIAEEIVASYFNLTNVNFMTFEFPDHKKSKDDVVEPFYIDNCYGTKYDEVPEIVKGDYSFWNGISFEDRAEQYKLLGLEGDSNKMPFERVSYKDTGVTAPEGFGEWYMSADVTGATWPTFWTRYEESVPKDTILSFWAYIEVDADEDDTFLIESHTNGIGYDRVKNTVGYAAKFNEWIEVKMLLNGPSDVNYTMFNFDDFDTPGSESRFGDKPVKIYMDNFKLEKSVASSTVGEDGTITLRNPLGAKSVMYTVEMPFKKGETIAFDIDFNNKGPITIWVLAEGQWNSATETNEYYALRHETWNGKKMIRGEVLKDIEYFQIVVSYHDENNRVANICTISNLHKAAPRATVQANGDVVITNPAGDARYVYDFARPVKKGQRIAFDIDFNTEEAVAVWLLQSGKWGKANEWFVYGYDKWEGKKTIVVEAKHDIEFFSIAHEYRGKEDYSKNVCTISNLRIVDPDVKVNPDGSVTITNLTGNKSVYYDVKIPVKKDQVIRFDMDFNTSAPLKVWVQAEGQWNAPGDKNEFFAYGYDDGWTGPRQITARANKDAEWFRILISYNDSGKDGWATNVCTIKNISVKTEAPSVSVDKDGNVTLSNSVEAAKRVSYKVQRPAVKGGKIKFDIDFNTTEPLAVWVIGDEKYQYYAWGYEGWDGEKTITADIKNDVNELMILVEYRGDESGYADNVCTIKNIQVFEPDVQVAPDGTVTVRNSTGTKRVSYIVNKELIKGSKIVFDVDFNVDEPLAIWVIGDQKYEYYAYGYGDWKKQQTITAETKQNISEFMILVEYRATPEDYAKNVCTISNLVTSEPDIIENPDGSITVRNQAGSDRVSYTYNKALEKGTEFSFDIDFNVDQPLAVWVIGDGVHEYYAYGYGDWKQSQKITTEITDDVSEVMILVEYRATSTDYSQNVCTISNIETKNPSVPLTFTGVHTDSGYNGTLSCFQVYLMGPSKAIIDEIAATTPPAVEIDGVSTENAITYKAGSSTLGINIPMSVLDATATAPSSMAKSHVVTLKAGTKLGKYVLTDDMEILLKNQTAGPNAMELKKMEFTALNNESAAQDANTRYRLFFCLKDDTQRSNALNNKPVELEVDGQKVEGATWYNYNQTLGIHVPYSMLESGVTQYANFQNAHVVTVKAGQLVGDYKLANDFSVKLQKQYAYEADSVTFESIHNDSGVNAGINSYQVWIVGPTNKGHIDALAASGKAKAYVDGVYNETNLTFTAGGSTIGVNIPFTALEDGVTQVGNLTRTHIVQFKAGTKFGDFTLTSDFSILLNRNAKPAVAQTVEFTGLGSGSAAQDNLSRYMIYLDGPDATQIANIHGQRVTLFVDGQPKATTTVYYNNLSGRLAVTLPYDQIESGVTKAADFSKAYEITFKAGTAASTYMVTKDLTLTLNQGSITVK